MEERYEYQNNAEGTTDGIGNLYIILPSKATTVSLEEECFQRQGSNFKWKTTADRMLCAGFEHYHTTNRKLSNRYAYEQANSTIPHILFVPRVMRRL